ncbi:MAG: NADH-quinone oxidoreductase subunit D, partial [Planctomycetes bacterium]|nr:NADH-quinone oxidoreductase subunit D [Planctomycetota bacterium]
MSHPGGLAHDEPWPYLWTMNFGPQHPATHTTLRLVLKLDGERVVDAMPDIGFLHSGFEKLGEHLDYNQYVTVTDRMNYVSPMANNVAWHLAVEKLLGIETPPRCQSIRVIVAELARISDHLLCLGAMGLDTGAFTHFIYAFNPREQISDIFEALCGARFTNSYTRVGGLMYDASPNAIEMIRDFLKQLPKTLSDMERLMNRNRIFVDRMKGVGVLSKAEAINRGCSGPIARASGVTRDLRKNEPYLNYRDFDFNVCCAEGGDCYARYLVRLAEIRESLKIIHQAVENLPAGPVNVVGTGPFFGEKTFFANQSRSENTDLSPSASRVILPDKKAVFSTIEGLISHFELVMANRGFRTPCEEIYCATEAPNGELGFYIVGDGGPRAYRARCRPPSFVHFA